MSDHHPLVSIIVVSYNGMDTIGKCLDTLFRQTYPNYEIIVYDNGSSDGTADFIARNFPEAKLTRGSENLGFGGANNKAVELAQGEYVAFINDDAYVAPGWLEPLVDALENDPTVGAAGAELICAEKPDVILCHGNCIHLSGIAYMNDRGSAVHSTSPMEVGGISGAAFLMRRQMFLEMGGFESLFFLYYEDTDLSLRIRLLGKRCVIIPGAVVYHNCETRFGIQKIYFLERNRYLSLFSLLKGFLLILMFPSMLLFEIFAWGYCLSRGKEALSGKLKAWKEVFGCHRWIAERRRKYTPFKVSTSFLMHAFTPLIHVDYVHDHKIIGFISQVVGYLVAIPSFLFVRLMNKE